MAHKSGGARRRAMTNGAGSSFNTIFNNHLATIPRAYGQFHPHEHLRCACRINHKSRNISVQAERTMDFAPYQSSPPEHERIASPEYNASPRASQDVRRPFSTDTRSPPPLQHPQPQRGWSGFDGQAGNWAGGSSAGGTPGAYPPAEVSEFDTTLGLRLDYEACLAYLAFPPLGPIVLLILERNSDYVR